MVCNHPWLRTLLCPPSTWLDFTQTNSYPGSSWVQYPLPLQPARLAGGSVNSQKDILSSTPCTSPWHLPALLLRVHHRSTALIVAQQLLHGTHRHSTALIVTQQELHSAHRHSTFAPRHSLPLHINCLQLTLSKLFRNLYIIIMSLLALQSCRFYITDCPILSSKLSSLNSGTILVACICTLYNFRMCFLNLWFQKFKFLNVSISIYLNST